MSLISDCSEEDFTTIVKQSDSLRDVVSALGYRANSGRVFYKVKNRITSLGLDISHFGSRYREKLSEGVRKYEIADILVKDSTYTNISSLKRRLVAEGYLDYKCSVCGNEGTWLGCPLTLQLNHLDGDPSNHSLENLEFLCPNCHTQTANFSGRNKVRK